MLVVPVVLIMLIGLVTNLPLEGVTTSTLFFKQAVFILIGILIILFGSLTPVHLIRQSTVSVILYVLSFLSLVGLLIFAPVINGAQSWFVLGSFVVQPVDFVKIVLCIVLAQYFANRHIYIHRISHLFITLGMTLVLFLLVFAQPDLGSSLILVSIWAGVVFTAEISKKHIAWFAFAAVGAVIVGWAFLTPVQQDRVLSFFDPVADLQASGYNSHQSKIAVGSGLLLGKGIGAGTQSKLGFLPLYESDFVFAAFAEEWGFVGVVILLSLFALLLFRLLYHAAYAQSNFDSLFIAGFTTLIFTHVLLHVGVNVGIFPVTGITLPFMSYGGSHIVAGSIGLAIVLWMARRTRSVRVSDLRAHRGGGVY